MFLFLTFVLFSSMLERIYADGGAFIALEHSQLWYWGYLQNWYFVRNGAGSTVPVTQLWSLAVEEQFYLVWPLVVFWCSTRRTMVIAASVCALSPLIRMDLIALGWSDTSVYMATIARMDALLVGALLAAWIRDGRPVPSPKTTAIALITILLLGLSSTALFDHGLKRNGFALQTWGLSVISISAALVILLAYSSSSTSFLNRVLNSKGLRTTGKYSYAIYLVHPPILWGFAGLLRSRGILLTSRTHLFGADYLVLLALSLVSTYLISALSWHIYEKHFLRLKKYFPTRIESV